MGVEIERKFLVKKEKLKIPLNGKRLRQGYLNSSPERTVRIRVSDENAFITIKGKNSRNGLVRYEWEKEIEKSEADELLALCEPGIISKTRYDINFKGHLFEVDIFDDENDGLIIAEIELTNADETFEKPEWLGIEVTGDRRFYNSNLSVKPYKTWKSDIL